MKKFIFITCAVFLSVFTLNVEAQTYGLYAGLNSSMLYQNSSAGVTVDNEAKLGLSLGMTIDFELTRSISFNSAIIASLRGTKNDYMDNDVTELYKDVYIVEKTNLMYFELPLLMNFKYDMKFFKFYGEIGPGFSMGFAGNEVYQRTEDGNTMKETESIHFGLDDANDDYNRFDAALIIGAGVIYDNIHFGVQTNIGFNNIAYNNDPSYILKNRSFQVFVSYKFTPYRFHTW